MRSKVKDFFERGAALPLALSASALIGFAAIYSVLVLPSTQSPIADMRIEPREQVVSEGETFEARVVVETSVPANVFGGELHFDSDVLSVDSISYNTSIADLWAERPWYSNGDGTLNFVGGTTQRGGFLGSGNLITVTFSAIGEGEGSLRMRDARVLQHNGLGTDIPLVEPLESIYTVRATSATTTSIDLGDREGTRYLIVENPPTTDLNGDGRHTFTDVSIFLLNTFSDDARFDFNQDGRVNNDDLRILMDRLYTYPCV